MVPVYIGDSLTDEDVFNVFKNGVTIRVGKNKSSAARYFFKRRSDVDVFLTKLAARGISRR
jgi:trehalose-6-phosphatase